MSSYGSPAPPPNPDTRLLPPGWVQQYDWNYKTWFYVNTTVNPPQPSWEHPASKQGFAPPPGPPPPDNRGYNASPYPPQGGYNQGPPPQQWGGQGYSGSGYQGGYPQGGGYYGGAPPPQPGQTVVYEQAKPKKSGMGMGTVALAGAGGLVGGMLLEDAIDDHDDRIQEQAYDNGYEDGQNDDFGGGDW